MSEPLRDSLGWSLARAAMGHRARAAELLGTIGLHPGQEFLLERLWEQDGQRLQSLARALLVGPPTVTKMVRRLEAAGLVVRESDPHDGRGTVVRLTPDGQALRGPVHRVWSELERELRANLREDEADELQRLLDQVRAGRDGATCVSPAPDLHLRVPSGAVDPERSTVVDLGSPRRDGDDHGSDRHHR